MDRKENPFDVTKAVDFSDRQIHDLWVDIGEGAGFSALVQPMSPMPMIIEGGKGSGKTHLMRYLTLTNQLLRFDNNVQQLLETDRYVGVYVRFGGLNASRFKGKHQTAEAWLDAFAYYSELWLGQLLLGCVRDLALLHPGIEEDTADIGSRLAALLTDEPSAPRTSIEEFLKYLRQEQRRVDHAINNCEVTRSLEISININRGGLIFDGCKIIADAASALHDVVFLFLLDEFENLEPEQQVYVNTLLREKRAPANFKVGTRSYGIRTYATLSADEAIVEGSEFSRLTLDEHLRAKPEAYGSFCRRMISKRLNDNPRLTATGQRFSSEAIDSFFVAPKSDPYLKEHTSFVFKKYHRRERPYFARLRQKIVLYAAEERKGKHRRKLADEIISNLQAPELPLIEKVHVLLLYRAWANSEPLREASLKIKRIHERFSSDQSNNAEYRRILDKFKGDLYAQLLRECRQRQRYVGLETFIHMSAGLPRNLLVLLKHVYAWADFRGEAPFTAPISIEAQQRGVSDAAAWFRDDARIPGRFSQKASNGVERLAELFRGVRFSDKPSECSLVTFSVNLGSLDEETYQIIDQCEKWSLLIRIPLGQKDKNSKRVDGKYQLSPMLAPLWQLPVARRGAIALTGDETKAIFSADDRAEFDAVLRQRLAPMNVPFNGNDLDQEQTELSFD